MIKFGQCKDLPSRFVPGEHVFFDVKKWDLTHEYGHDGDLDDCELVEVKEVTFTESQVLYRLELIKGSDQIVWHQVESFYLEECPF